MTMFARYFPLVGGIIKPAEETQKQYARYSIHFVKQFIIVEVITVLLTVAYIEIGHDKGWKRASTWYTCIHTHHHFPWQK